MVAFRISREEQKKSAIDRSAWTYKNRWVAGGWGALPSVLGFGFIFGVE